MNRVELALSFLEACEEDGCETVEYLQEALRTWALCENYGVDIRQLEQLLIAWKNG